MSKFNPTTTGSNKTTNVAGGSAFKLNAKQKLVTQVFTTFFNEKKFYGDNSTDIKVAVKTVLDTDPQFVSNLAIIARTEMNLRSISHVLLAELANHPRGKKFVIKTLKAIALRPDDMTETLAYYIANFGKPIPNSLKKGLADVFKKFDEYQLAKYNRDGAVKLKDIILICHPKPNNEEQAKLFKKVLDNALETPYTWETIISNNDGRSKKEKWEEVIDMWVGIK